MTTIVTRAYKDLDTAKSVVEALRAERHPDRDMDLFNKGDANLADKLAAAKVPAEAVPALVKAIEGGKPVVVARAEITPFGAAARAKNVLDAFNPVTVQGTDGDFYLSTVPLDGTAETIDSTHGRFFTTVQDIRAKRNWSFSAMMGWKMKSDRRPAPHLVHRGRKLFTEGYMPLLSDRKPVEGAIYREKKLFSAGFYPMLSDRKPADGLVMKDHPFMSQRFWKAPLLSERR
ncbi:hypothetical protein [Rhodobaculum claviforme]|uniref:Uncharacterized protein n=1 Tax=Rhodobaculum claviforme TaxID=1549854 RepID=A0A934TJN8_9RHOB|nr:hypothetical protein [Rhodobaculum claviforme]MBK5927052.1 hypothetical protein [Rhodobaculum claviforme]